MSFPEHAIVTIIDKGSATPIDFSHGTAIPIPLNTPLAIAEFGLAVEQGQIHNYATLTGAVGIQSQTQSFSGTPDKIVLQISRRNTTPASIPITIFETHQTLLGQGEEINMTFSFTDGGNEVPIPTGYHGYTLTVHRESVEPIPSLEPTIIGPIQFEGTSYITDEPSSSGQCDLTLCDLSLEVRAVQNTTSVTNNTVDQINSTTNQINSTLEDACDANIVSISSTDIVPNGYVITAPGHYCLAEHISYSNPTTPAITISSECVYLDLNGYTIDLTDTGFAGIAINGVANVQIKNGTIKNSSRPVPADAFPFVSLNPLVANPTSARGFGIALLAGSSNVIIEDIVTDRVFTGIGNVGIVRQVDINRCYMYNFGFEYGASGSLNFRGTGFTFANSVLGIESINIRNCVAEGLTGQHGIAFRNVTTGLISHCIIKVGYNVVPSPANVNDRTHGIRLNTCNGIDIKNCKTDGGRQGIVINSFCACIDCEVINYTAIGFQIGQNQSNSSLIRCLATTTNIITPATGNAEFGVGIYLIGAHHNLVEDCQSTGNRLGTIQAGLSLTFNTTPNFPSHNTIRNCSLWNNTNGLVVGTSVTGAQSTNNTVRDCNIWSNDTGILINGPSTSNSFSDNVINNNNNGIVVDSNATSNSFRNNVINHNNNTGILINLAATSNSFINNVINHNTVIGVNDANPLNANTYTHNQAFENGPSSGTVQTQQYTATVEYQWDINTFPAVNPSFANLWKSI